MMRVTIQTIANLANVSRGTVDRVLNNRPGVKPETAQRVQDIIKALDYQPNLLAKNLVNLKNQFKIAVIMLPDYNPFVAEIRKGVEQAARDLYDYGITVDAYVMHSISAQEQCQMLRRFEEEQYSGIALSAIEDDSVRREINRLVEGGLTVVTFNSDIQDTKRLCFVGQDHVKGGRSAGSLMGRLLAGKGRIVLITSSAHLLCHVERMRGFRDKMAEEYPDIEITAAYENQDLDTGSVEAIMHAHQRFQTIDGIYITGGGTGGVGKALRILGLDGKVAVVSHDFVPETVALVKDKVIDFTIGQAPFEQGYRPVKIIFDHIANKKTPGNLAGTINLDIRMEENIDL